jgi:hypothetical protein
MTLTCNCRRVVGRAMPGDREHAEWRVVKSRRWDCPSCGLDRKRLLASMCAEGGVTRMVTLTFDQPRVPGSLTACAREDHRACPPGHEVLPVEAHRPARHRHCDWSSHGYWHVPQKAGRSAGWRWKVTPSCRHCCRWVSGALERWVKRLRRRWPDVQYLQAREVHKSGALHVHVAVRGLPAGVTRKSKSGLVLKGAWQGVGGGFCDVGRHGENAGSDAGFYVGKYLAKAHTDTFARGYRRWSRSGDLAPHVRMSAPPGDPEDDGGWSDPAAPIVLGGWLHPDGTERPWRYWAHEDHPRSVDLGGLVLATARVEVRAPRSGGLDPSTANPPQGLALVLREACRKAASPTPGRVRGCWEVLTLL